MVAARRPVAAKRATRRRARRALCAASVALAGAALPPAAAPAAQPPTLSALTVTAGPRPFAGDGRLLATISPNGDGLRDAARISFVLSEPASVELEVTRTRRRPTTVSERTLRLGAGRAVLTWRPPAEIEPRTYLVRLTVTGANGASRVYGAPTSLVGRYPRGPVVRVLGVDAALAEPSYRPGELATLRVATDASALTLQAFRAGPEHEATTADDVLNGVPAAPPVQEGWARRRDAPQTLRFRVGPWESGLYFVRLDADDGRVGYAPFVVRPTRLGEHRVAVVLPTNTWQAYNFYDADADGDGWGDTWYAGGTRTTLALGRPFLDRGVPPLYRQIELGFLRWLAGGGRQVDYLSDSDLSAVAAGDELARAYDLVVFPGHSEYETEHAFDVVRRFRDLGGNLAFLSANDFFWRVEAGDGTLTRAAQFRRGGLPEAQLIGVQYRGNDAFRHGPYVVGQTSLAPWLWEGTGLADGSTFGDFGTEIDATAPATPPGTLVLARIPDLLGPGFSAQMSYYESAAGARVFAAGVLDFCSAATTQPVARLLDNLWARLTG